MWNYSNNDFGGNERAMIEPPVSGRKVFLRVVMQGDYDTIGFCAGCAANNKSVDSSPQTRAAVSSAMHPVSSGPGSGTYEPGAYCADGMTPSLWAVSPTFESNEWHAVFPEPVIGSGSFIVFGEGFQQTPKPEAPVSFAMQRYTESGMDRESGSQLPFIEIRVSFSTDRPSSASRDDALGRLQSETKPRADGYSFAFTMWREGELTVLLTGSARWNAALFQELRSSFKISAR